MAIINFDYLNDDYEDFRIKLNLISQLFGDGANIPLGETNLISAMNRIVNTQNAATTIAANILEEFTLNSGVTVDGVLIKDNVIFPSQIEIQSNSSSLLLKDNDGILNEKFLTLNNNAKIFSIGILNDNKLDKKDFIQFHRVGNNLSDIRVFSDININSNILSFRNNTNSAIKDSSSLDQIWFDTTNNIFHFSQASAYKGIGNSKIQINSLFLNGSLPQVRFNDPSQTLNNKIWKIISKNRSLVFQTNNDAENSSKDILEFIRDGLNSSEMIFRGNSLRIKGDTTSSLILESISNNNSIIQFLENSQSRVNIFYDRVNDELNIEKRLITNSSIVNFLKLRNTHIDIQKDLFFRNRSLISNYNTVSNIDPELSANVDCIWNNNASVTSINGNITGTWHFQNNIAYKNPGNSLGKFGAINLDLWLEIWNKNAPTNNGKYRFVSRQDSKFSLYLQNDASTSQAEVFTVTRNANTPISFDINAILKTNVITELTPNAGLTISGVKLINSTVQTNTITELTANSGVTVAGVTNRDGFINISETKAIQCTGDLNFLIDSNNNSTSNVLNIYKNSISNENRILSLNENGRMSITSIDGNSLEITNIAANTVTSRSFISFNQTVTAGTSGTRMGWVGFGSQGSNNMTMFSDIGDIEIKTSANVTIDSSNLTVDSPITTNNNSINVGTSSLILGSNNGIYKESNDIIIRQESVDAGSLILRTVGSIVFDIDSNNNNTGKSFDWRHNGSTSLMTLSDNGLLNLFVDIITNNNNIRIGTGLLSFDSGNTDYLQFNQGSNTLSVVANGSVANSRISCGGITFGDEELTNYDEGTWVPRFFDGNTQITGSSGNTDVNSAVAYYTRIGNIVTLFISNIHWAITGTYAGTTKGSYPALSGVFSIRDCPFAAFDEAAGSLFGSAVGSGNRCPNVYIGDGENTIRFSDFEYLAGFGLRSLTITYRVA